MLKFFKFTGRSRRAKLLQLVLITALLAALGSYLDEAYIAEWRGFLPGESDAGSPLFFIVLAVMAWPLIATMVRRLHDHNKSGWYLLIAFTGIGILPLLLWFLTKGNKQPNKFG